MSKKRVIQVFEHECIYLKGKAQTEKFLTTEELDKLYEYNDRTGNLYFTAIRHGIKFRQYVGVIQIGGLIIEILPKADRDTNNTKNDYNLWHRVLIDMLKTCRKINIKSDNEAKLKRRNHSILDLYYQLFIDEVFILLRRGLIKQYRRTENNVNVLKGRLLFSKNIERNLIRKDRFYSVHQTYDYNSIFNQILLKAINILEQTSYSQQIQDAVHKIRLLMDNISFKEIYISDFESLRWCRRTESYRRAINLAQLIILNYSPDIRTGKENMIAILFDMNKLWEEYIFRLLQLANKENTYRLSYQNSMRFWENKKIRPDILIENQKTNERYILDTKWKLISSNNPSDDDLKQMYVYNIYWNVKRSFLLYPSSRGQINRSGNYHKGREGENACELVFIDILSEGKLDKNKGKEILSLISKQE